MLPHIHTEYLQTIAKDQLIICSEDPFLPLRNAILERSPELKDRNCPAIIFTRIRGSKNESEKNLVVQSQVILDWCTCRPKLPCLDRTENPSGFVEPHHLFPQINDFISGHLGASGQLVIILDRVDRLTYDQLFFLMASIKHSSPKFGMLMITTPKHLSQFRIERPESYLEFRKSTDAIVTDYYSTEDFEHLLYRSTTFRAPLRKRIIPPSPDE